jgi:hypothetical protein
LPPVGNVFLFARAGCPLSPDLYLIRLGAVATLQALNAVDDIPADADLLFTDLFSIVFFQLEGEYWAN